MGARIRVAALLAAALAGAAASSFALAAPSNLGRDWARETERMAHPSPGDIIVIAHRACWRSTAENSIAAVDACIAMGVDGVEFDVRHTRDGAAVIMHDDTVDRMTDGHGKVSDLTLAAFSALRLRRGAGGPDAALTDWHPPTLTQYLAAAKGRLWLVFDVKDDSQVEAFHTAQASGVAPQAIFFYECRSGLLRDKVKTFWDKVVVAPIVFGRDGPLAPAEGSCPSHPANMIHAKWSTPGYLEAAQAASSRRQERLWIATMFPEDNAGSDDERAVLDPSKVWGRQIGAGANMIMTNRPSELLVFLSGRTPGHG